VAPEPQIGHRHPLERGRQILVAAAAEIVRAIQRRVVSRAAECALPK
jgi:hypothetical protein